ncbi:peptidoglycan hydrolase-like protein with peptidoglycan-binding domain [Rhodoligotrophos appendicifer]|uniref:peptidoglycan-binding domain-containing protein n=1 Tax=Rhodoligotrophos appendicifer TaxID=987056 RepID=UPI001185FD47|nr:peptidoglycan-binding domain-containing protein [Rhodoligotrophos appendicifer]
MSAPDRAGVGWLHQLIRTACFFLAISLSFPSLAQDGRAPLTSAGTLAITGFSGTSAERGGFLSDAPGLDETMIDLNGGSLKVFDISAAQGKPDAQMFDRPPLLSISARDIGQVFGLALDDAEAPNIYATATSAFGLQIVHPDKGGKIARIKTGEPGAIWMPGQFGQGGGPGSVWRIDGRTGQVTLFTTIGQSDRGNSGPGLGNISFDKTHQQFFVSDLDTGLIHRLDISGKDLGSFDHGTKGREAARLAPVVDDSVAADIAAATFDAEDPDSWGFTAPGRRVWGLTYHQKRLYYAVWEGPQVWSVGIDENGDFTQDIRHEFDVKSTPKTYPISDLAFDGEGRLYVAQRGEIRSRYDYGTFALPRKSQVLRFSRDGAEGPWRTEPEAFAIGFPATHQNAAGGISLGYGYDDQGKLNTKECWGTIWATGDSLRQSGSEQERLAKNGPAVVHGAQGFSASLEGNESVPPFKSYFLDFDGRFDDPNRAGHVGDVAAVQLCGSTEDGLVVSDNGESPETPAAPVSGPTDPEASRRASAPLVDQYGNPVGKPTTQEPAQSAAPAVASKAEPSPGQTPNAPPQRALTSPPPTPRSVELAPPFDLSLSVRAGLERCASEFGCPFSIIIANNGPGPYRGPLAIAEEVDTAVATLADWSPRKWSCNRRETTFLCTHPEITIEPGGMVTLRLEFVPWRVPARLLQNCARLAWEDGMFHGRTTLVQQNLTMLGYEPGAADGLDGSRTQQAVGAYRADRKMSGTGSIGPDLLKEMYGRWGTGDLNGAGDRDCASVDLRRQNRNVSVAPRCDETSVLIKGRCVSQQALCGGGRNFQAAGNLCSCPSQSPLWDVRNGQCISYESPKRTSIAIGEPAETDPADATDLRREDDAADQAGKDAPQTTPRNVARPRVAPTSKDEVLPAENHPAEVTLPDTAVAPGDGEQIPCPGDQGWNVTAKQCTCPQDKPIWDKTLTRCVSAGVEPPKPQIQVCSGNRVWSDEKTTCVCPPDKPSWNAADQSCS